MKTVETIKESIYCTTSLIPVVGSGVQHLKIKQIDKKIQGSYAHILTLDNKAELTRVRKLAASAVILDIALIVGTVAAAVFSALAPVSAAIIGGVLLLDLVARLSTVNRASSRLNSDESKSRGLVDNKGEEQDDQDNVVSTSSKESQQQQVEEKS